jgi:hypothetical protein
MADAGEPHHPDSGERSAIRTDGPTSPLLSDNRGDNDGASR